MSGETIQSHDPTNPARAVAEVAVPSPAGVEAAVAGAEAAQPDWAADAPGRAAALGAMADAVAAACDGLAGAIVEEVGKPVGEARAEVGRAVAILRFYAQAALDPVGEVYPGSSPGARIVVRREPLGVVLAICPWNFPLAIPLWKAAPALAYGNTVLVKPAAPAVGVATRLAAIAAEGLPEGVLSVLAVPGARAGELLDDPRVAGATFTGSTATGLAVAARLAARGAPAQAEMGGQNPAIVLEDADPAAAADAIVAGAMSYSGQKCTATRRAIVVGAIADDAIAALAERVGALAVGDPREEATVVGPLIDADAADGFRSRVEGALGRGATPLAAAEPPPGDGHFVAPTLLAADDPADEVNQEETFGPLLTVIRVADADEAVRVANATRFGLVGAVHGRDVERAAEVASRLDCGLLRINAPTPGVDYYAPFGGSRLSSFGPREQGRAAREFFTATRTMTIVG